jgi:hypothetical protein
VHIKAFRQFLQPVICGPFIETPSNNSAGTVGGRSTDRVKLSDPVATPQTQMGGEHAQSICKIKPLHTNSLDPLTHENSINELAQFNSIARNLNPLEVGFNFDCVSGYGGMASAQPPVGLFQGHYMRIKPVYDPQRSFGATPLIETTCLAHIIDAMRIIFFRIP